MQKTNLLLLLSFLFHQFSFSQSVKNSDSALIKYIIAFNDSIDNAVIQKNISYLHDAYSDDFKFTHSTGKIDNKKSWLNNVLKPSTRYQSRINSNLKVDIFGNYILVTGILTSIAGEKQNSRTYILPYARIFQTNKQGKWQLIIHNSVTDLK